jgi:uncharacterized protein (TIGR02145 family)
MNSITKKIVLISVLLIQSVYFQVFAQSPQKFSYQAVIRDASGKIAENKLVNIRISILQGSSNGSTIFKEEHSDTTNVNGLVSLQIGSKIKFNIDWSKGPFFIKTELKNLGEANYVDYGTTQMLSVPYALYAEKSGSSATQGPKGDTGLQGLPGKDGKDGKDGAQGPKGDKGDTGLQGLPGKDGMDGKDGVQGLKGDKGDTGLPGKDGMDGKDGAQGLKGDKGDTGLQGLPGKDGMDGTDGAQGPKGDNGDTGLQGLPGKDGKEGVQGLKGDNGDTGLPGKDGMDGKDGAQGPKGDSGLQGLPGKDGLDGKDGAQGLKGDKGIDGKVEFQNLRVSASGDTLYLTNGNFVIIPGISAANTGANTPPTSGYGPNITDIDGNTYKTIYIGSQQWMGENLKTTRYSDGTEIPNITDNTEWIYIRKGAYCIYDNDSKNNNIYGKLYNWYVTNTTANGNKNVCPTGWHVPSDGDWTILTDYLGGDSISGGKMKEVANNLWGNQNTQSTNSSLFTALPSGFRFANSNNFMLLGRNCFWWSSSLTDQPDFSWVRRIYSSENKLERYKDVIYYGFSIRCLKD